MGVINNKQLVKYARGQLGRMYVYGCFGQLGSESVYQGKLKQYPARIGKWPKSTYVVGYGQKWHDCAGLPKGAIFCRGEIDGVPRYSSQFDYSADGIINICKAQGQVWDVDKMPKNITGLVMWKPGHMGVWDADTQTTIEAKGHMAGVCETTDTPWQLAGRLPASWVDYIIDPTPAPAPEPDPKGDKIMLEVTTLRKGSKGPEVFAVQSILKGKGYKGKGKVLALDSSFGGATEDAVMQYQKDHAATCGASDGVVGARTWQSLINT